LKHLIETQDIIKNKNKITVWSDCGPHFRNGEMVAFLLISLPKQDKNIEWHLFTEGHGKSACDSHFSLLTRWQKQAELQQFLISTTDYITAIQQQIRNTVRGDEGNVQLEDFDFHRPELMETAHIPHIKLYHCFHATPDAHHDNEFEATAYILSSDVQGKKLALKLKSKHDDRICKKPAELSVPDPLASLTDQIRNLQRNRNEIHAEELVDMMNKLSLGSLQTSSKGSRKRKTVEHHTSNDFPNPSPKRSKPNKASEPNTNTIISTSISQSTTTVTAAINLKNIMPLPGQLVCSPTSILVGDRVASMMSIIDQAVDVVILEADTLTRNRGSSRR
jgi:hypothetical protein